MDGVNDDKHENDDDDDEIDAAVHGIFFFQVTRGLLGRLTPSSFT